MSEDSMFRFKKVRHNPKLFVAMTSLTVPEFLKLLSSFRAAWEDYKSKHNHVGRPKQFYCIEDMLVFILYYLKCYPLQEVFAYSFRMSQGDANYWIHLLARVLKNALDRGGYLPERTAEGLFEVLKKELERRLQEQSASGDENEERRTVIEIGIDTTERRIVRPSDYDVQKEFYSGKTKSHSLKNGIIGDLDTSKVYGLGATVAGKTSDKRSAEDEGYKFPSGTNTFVDKAYQGYNPPGATMYQPKKKPKNGELTDEEMRMNSAISSCREAIEHIISGIKRLRIVKDVLRNTKDQFRDLVLELACGLHDFREECRAPSR
jgi:hypothetical protein